MMVPLVSISCLAFNHSKYIRQCLDGFLMQKTNFIYEIVIHDDASTDGTEEIIREYEKRYPDLIFSIYQKENQFSKGVKPTWVFNAPSWRGKYIALCEGDDYWTDPYKLQKQVDILDSNSAIVMATHNADVYSMAKSKVIRKLIPFKSSGIAEKSSVVSRENGPIHTASMMFRVDIIPEIIKIMKTVPVGDYYIAIYSLLYGEIFHINEIMSVYRLNDQSLTGRKRTGKTYIEIHRKHSESLKIYNERTDYTYSQEIELFLRKKSRELLQNFVKIGLLKNVIRFRIYLVSIKNYLNLKDYLWVLKLALKKQIKLIIRRY